MPRCGSPPSAPPSPDAEWQARLDLAACYRLCEGYGMSDMIYTHITARVPGSPGHFLINPNGMLFGEITASSLLKVSVDGEVLYKPDLPYGAAPRRLHHPQRHLPGAAGCDGGDAYPHHRRDGGLRAEMRAAAADPDGDALLRPHRLP